jgi:molybdenum cofactor synthesis domain-containing protein
MQRFLRVMMLKEARSKLEGHWQPRPRVVDLALNEAAGRVLAEAIRSKIDIPPFDRATYDGYALRAADTFGAEEGKPVGLSRVGEIRAGDNPKIKLADHECVEIATGAPIPEGADAVVMVEYSNASGDMVEIHRSAAPGENVTKRGSEIKCGAEVLGLGRALTSSAIGVLAAVGVQRVKVHASPRVAVISSGAELAKPGSNLEPGQVYDINGLTIPDAVRQSGGEPTYLGIAGDEVSGIKDLVEEGLSGYDIVVISGGSSAGAGDLVPEAIDGLGEPGVLVHGIAMKPGKPTLVAVVRNKPVFGLPGYPVSALMVFDQLVAPYLRQLAGLQPRERETVRAKLTAKILSARGRNEFVPVRLRREGGGFSAAPIRKGSGAITSLAEADGYISVPVEDEIVDEGATIEVALFGGVELA